MKKKLSFTWVDVSKLWFDIVVLSVIDHQKQ